LIPYNKPIL